MGIKYYVAALFSFVVWGAFSLVLKPLSDYPAFDILTYRVGFAAITIGLISLVFRSKITYQNIRIIKSMSENERWQMLIFLVFSAIMLSLNWYSFIFVMNAVSVKATSLAYLICPILTTVLASIFLKERLNSGQWLAVGMSIISCMMLSYGHFMDMVYSMIIALSYAIYLVLQKANNKLDKFFTLTIHIVLSALFLVPFGVGESGGPAYSNLFYQLVFLIATLFTIIPLFLNMYALKGLDSSVVGVLLYINPIIAFLLAVFYFKEHINLLQAIAYGIILVAVILFNISYLYFKNKKPFLK